MMGGLLNSVTFELGARTMERKRGMFTFGVSNLVGEMTTKSGGLWM